MPRSREAYKRKQQKAVRAGVGKVSTASAEHMSVQKSETQTDTKNHTMTKGSFPVFTPRTMKWMVLMLALWDIPVGVVYGALSEFNILNIVLSVVYLNPVTLLVAGILARFTVNRFFGSTPPLRMLDGVAVACIGVVIAVALQFVVFFATPHLFHSKIPPYWGVVGLLAISDVLTFVFLYFAIPMLYRLLTKTNRAAIV